jgi:hypothetical protein
MVMEPWNNPITLTRAWCLWEVYCTSHTNSKFEVAMSVGARRNFRETILTDLDTYESMLATVDLVKAESFNENDKEQINICCK